MISRFSAAVMVLLRGHVLVDRVDPMHPGLAVGGGVELSHQPVAVQDRQREVPPTALGSPRRPGHSAMSAR